MKNAASQVTQWLWEFGDENKERVVQTYVAAGQPYGLNITLYLSAIENDGKAKYMRIYGDSHNFSPCYTGIGEALDLRVIW